MTTDAKPPLRSEQKPAVGELVEIVKTVVYALLIALVLRVFLFQPYTIPSASMSPTCTGATTSSSPSGATAGASTRSPSARRCSTAAFLPAPKRGDIIVFKLPRDDHVDYIKRLIGLPGDHIQVPTGQSTSTTSR